MAKLFHNSQLLSRSWYALLPSKKLKNGTAKSVTLHQNKVALYRDVNGQLGALHAYCPHMGADLSLGQVQQDRLVCPYHKWSFKKDGSCDKAFKAVSYPIIERYGYIWVFNGEEVEFPFPELEWSEQDFHVIRLPINKTRCHLHVLGTNVADFHHLETLHGFKFDGQPQLKLETENQLTHTYRIEYSPKSILEKYFTWRFGRFFDFDITLYGDNTVIMKVDSNRYHLHAVINLLPDSQGHSIAKTILFVPKGKGLVRLLSLNLCKLPMLLASFAVVQLQDVKLFNNIRFRPRPVETDQSVVRYMQLVERLGAFDPVEASKCVPAQKGER